MGRIRSKKTFFLFLFPPYLFFLNSSVHGISQAAILECVAISHSRGSSWPRGGARPWNTSPALAGGFFTTSATGSVLIECGMTSKCETQIPKLNWPSPKAKKQHILPGLEPIKFCSHTCMTVRCVSVKRIDVLWKAPKNILWLMTGKLETSRRNLLLTERNPRLPDFIPGFSTPGVLLESDELHVTRITQKWGGEWVYPFLCPWTFRLPVSYLE